MIATFYTTDDGFQSTLVLNNKGPNWIAVTPILYGWNGHSFTAPAVNVEGQSSLQVDLNKLAGNAGPQFRSGSFEFTYSGRLLEMGGGLTIVNAEKSLIFDEQMLEPGMKFSSSDFESVFAIPFESTEVNVIVTNMTDKLLAIDGQATLAGFPIKIPIPLVLGPRQNRVVTLPQGLTKRAKAGAISLKHNGEKGALMAIVHLQEKGKGFSATINFSNHGQGKTTQLQGAGLRLDRIDGRNLTPVVVVRNNSEETTTVVARVPYKASNGSEDFIALPQLSLDPGEIGFLDTSDPKLRRIDFATAGLEIEYTGTPGTVIASAYSVSASGNQVFGLPLKDPQGGMSSTGGYPWFINENGSTVVFIKNTTNEPQQFHLDIIYPGGMWSSNLKTLANGQTYKLDVREIRDTQMEGSEGNAIPITATVGHVSWSVFGPKDKTLIGRAQTVNFSNSLSSTYECQCYCTAGYGEARMVPATASGFSGDTQKFTAQMRNVNCMGVPGGWFDAYGVTYSSNHLEATVDSSGLATAIGVGNAVIFGRFTAIEIVRTGQYQCSPFEKQVTTSGFWEFAPKINSISASEGFQGNTHSVTISGRFGSSPFVQVSGTGITTSITNASSTSISIDFTIAENAELGNRAVTVSSSGLTSNSVNFVVQQIPQYTIETITFDKPSVAKESSSANVTVTVSASKNIGNTKASINLFQATNTAVNIEFTDADKTIETTEFPASGGSLSVSFAIKTSANNTGTGPVRFRAKIMDVKKGDTSLAISAYRVTPMDGLLSGEAAFIVNP